MGAYVYALRGSPASTVKIYDQWFGKVIDAGRVSYLYKPSWADDTHGDSLSARAEATIDRWWGDERPSYAIVTEGPAKAGDTVLTWRECQDFVRDDPDWEGLQVGVLVPLQSAMFKAAKFYVGSAHDYTGWVRAETLKHTQFHTVWGWYINALKEMEVYPDGSRRCDQTGRPAQDLGTTKEWLAALRGRLRAHDHEADPNMGWSKVVLGDA